jgi:CheY-like chemotaxis protein
MNQPAPSPLHILLAEDDNDDAFFFHRALDKAGVRHMVIRASNGQDAIGYLGKCLPVAGQPQEPMPDLLILDLKMPGMDGFGVMEWVQQQPFLNPLPVVILSSSSLFSDFERAKALGADGYYVKPFDSSKLVDIVHQLRSGQLNPAWKPASHTRDGRRLCGPPIALER